jgi:hypothetical protein
MKGMKHMLDGYIKSFHSYISKEDNKIGMKIESYLKKFTNHPFYYLGIIFQFSLYIICWGTVLVIAMINPRSFLTILEVFTSLALNLESGVFIAFMLYTSRKMSVSKNIEIIDPLPGF